MTRETYFRLEPSPYYEGKYTIAIDFTKLPPMKTTGSYSILPARLLNLPYQDYIRMCRDSLKAEIVGKGKLYPTIYFTKTLSTIAFIRLLNSRMQVIMWEKEHPQWKEHCDYIKNKYLIEDK